MLFVVIFCSYLPDKGQECQWAKEAIQRCITAEVAKVIWHGPNQILQKKRVIQFPNWLNIFINSTGQVTRSEGHLHGVIKIMKHLILWVKIKWSDWRTHVVYSHMFYGWVMCLRRSITSANRMSLIQNPDIKDPQILIKGSLKSSLHYDSMSNTLPLSLPYAQIYHPW